MYLISTQGSRHLLEFLRNLTPQVLLLTTALVLFVLWQKNGGFLYPALFFAVVGVFLMALIANASNFLDNAFADAVAIAAERDRQKAAAADGRVSASEMVRYIWKEKPRALVEFLIASVVIYVALAAILLAAFLAALRAFG